ncbi:hypothetical protein BON22_2547 [Cyberlindnera fabianii]|uniref:Uncharacterized protein n=1 Tax=Cyberlindnera fabianii TaxID=36022 RepID=A0A1V2L6S9_CYBFA|nr:hypothetical protein BON22_2547 [Cyberlindnera fabianii]
MYRMANPYRQQPQSKGLCWTDPEPWETQARLDKPRERAQGWRDYSRPLAGKGRPSKLSGSGTSRISGRDGTSSGRFKDRKKDQQKDTYSAPPEVLYKQIGSAGLAYVDKSTEASYNWLTKTYPLPKGEQTKNMRSLKDICAMKVAERAHNLNSIHLQSVTWSVMRRTKTVFNMQREWKDVDWDDWKLIDAEGREMEKLSWGMKAQAFIRKYNLPDSGVEMERDVIWLDFNVMNHVFADREYDTTEGQFDHMWKLGEVMSYTQTMVLTRRKDAKSETPPTLSGSLNRKAVKKPALKRKKLINIRDAKSFFDL